jgi:hypothetical protein
MTDLLSTIAFFAVAALVGWLVGLVICGSFQPLRRVALLAAVLLAWAVTMGGILTAASPPRLSLVQFAVVLLGASPVVVVSSVASLLARHFRVSRSATLAGAATAAAVSSPLCTLALFVSACSLAGECV